MPAISVILPTYNRVSLLPRAITSVLSQTYQDIELIVVDDASTDGTRNYIEQIADPRVIYHRLSKNRGVAGARNAGVKLASAPLLAFQDSDDEWLLDKLAMQVSAMNMARETCDINLCGIFRLDGSKLLTKVNALVESGGIINHEAVLTAGTIYTQTWLVKRELVQKVGGFDEHMKIWDDWELLMRLSEYSKISTIPAPLVVSAKMPDSLSVIAPKWVQDLRHILSKHDGHLQNYPRAHALIRYMLARNLCNEGRWKEARGTLLSSIGHYPWHSRAWQLLGISICPPLAQKILSLRAD